MLDATSTLKVLRVVKEPQKPVPTNKSALDEIVLL
jgi:hypothetical protein